MVGKLVSWKISEISSCENGLYQNSFVPQIAVKFKL
jgi:hypothetical protein